MKRIQPRRWMPAAVLLLAMAAMALEGDTGTDPAWKYAWGENGGCRRAGDDRDD